MFIWLYFKLLVKFCYTYIWGAKTIKKNTNSTQNKSQTHRAKQHKVTSFLSTYCELSTETCFENVYSLSPWYSNAAIPPFLCSAESTAVSVCHHSHHVVVQVQITITKSVSNFRGIRIGRGNSVAPGKTEELSYDTYLVLWLQHSCFITTGAAN